MQNDSASAQDPLFKTIPREATLSERVTAQIENLIIANHLQPGDRLPPERELAQQFGVSRTVIREATRTLTAKGLLEARPGGGTVVCAPTAETVAQSMRLYLRAGQTELDYDKVHEVRRLLEVEIAGLAAERRTPEDLEKLQTILDAVPAVGHDRDGLARNDVSFHAALAEATHNELFSLLLGSIADSLLTVRQLGFSVPGMPARTLKYHQAIFEQVRAGNREQARRAMTEHLLESEDTMRRAMALYQQS